MTGSLAWQRCAAQDCTGARINADRCLRHTAPAIRWAVLVSDAPLDARGVAIDAELLGELRRARGGGTPRLSVASFEGASFVDADFSATTFAADVSFRAATFAGTTGFTGAVFAAQVDFAGATFERLSLARTEFQRASVIGPLVASESVALDHAHFAERVDVAISAGSVDGNGLQLDGGGSLRLRHADVSLAHVQCLRPCRIAGELRPFEGERDSSGAATPRLRSLCESDASGVTLAALDLTDCRFRGARNLDALQIEPSATFARTSKLRRAAGRAPRWTWTSRRVLAEEVALRERRADALRPQEVGVLYRALRKALEDKKDEPGAADFYYGEMEMRRLASPRLSGERVLLSVYGACSGYALRPSRALLGWIAVVALFALLLSFDGFDSAAAQEAKVTVPGGLALGVFAAEIATGLLRPPEATVLSTYGRYLQVVLRLLGPLLLGLAVLAIRGRVKR